MPKNIKKVPLSNEAEALKEMKIFFSKNAVKRLDDVLKLKLNLKTNLNNSTYLNNLSGSSSSNNLNNLSSSSGLNNLSIENDFSNNLNNQFQLPLNYSIDENENVIKLKISDNLNANQKEDNNIKEYTLPLYTCPATGYKFFYFYLPTKYINNDLELQPRPLEFKRLWELYKHLLSNSQLTPSVCRISGNKVYLFDGQHKAAAQIWAGRDAIECKIYISPSVKVLKETNLIAHDKLRQMPFFTSVLIKKWSSIFYEEWNQYIEQPGNKSESDFVNFLISKGKKKNDAINMLESNIYETILEDNNNKIKKFIEDYSTDNKKPLTVNRLKQSFFKKFIAPPPLVISLEESDNLREFERINAIKLINIIVKYSLENLWNPQANDENHKISEMIYLNGAFKATCSLIKDVIAAVLELYDQTERNEILLRKITEDNWQLIEKSIEAIFSNRIWSDNSQENFNNLRASNENAVRKYLAKKGLSVNWILNYSMNSNENFID